MKKFAFLFLFGFALSFSQTIYRSENVQFSESLSADMVFGTFKKDGYLYIAAQKGLFTYDGYIFVESDIQDAVGNFYADKTGIYLEEYTKGLVFTKNIFSSAKVLRKVNYFDANPDNDHYENIFRDSSGNIWSSDFHNIKYFNPVSKKAILFPIRRNHGQLDFKINYFPLGKNLLLTSGIGIFYWDYKTNSLKKISEEKVISAINIDSKIIVIMASGAVAEFSLKDGKFRPLGINLAGHHFAGQVISIEKAASYDDKNVYEINLKNHTKHKIFDIVKLGYIL